MILQNLQVNYEDLPQLEEVIFTKHPKKYLWLRLLKKSIFLFLLLIGVVVFIVTNDREFIYLIIAALAILAILILSIEIKSFGTRAYALREKDISYKSGWIFFTLTTLPFNRIQHSEISQGPLERAFKLSSLKIYTAGGSSSDLEIGGLDNLEAEKLKAYISKVTGKDD